MLKFHFLSHFQNKLEVEAAKPKADIMEEDGGESKPLSIAQVVYRENRVSF